MKTNQLLGVIGGVLLVASTLIPSHGIIMWNWLSAISLLPLVGLMPVVLAGSGIIGALMAKSGKGMIALVCGAVALLYILIAMEFRVQALFQDIIGIAVLAGSVLLIASGVMKSN